MSSQEIIQLSNNLQMKENQVKCFLLQEFDTEMDFTHKIRLDSHNNNFTIVLNFLAMFFLMMKNLC